MRNFIRVGLLSAALGLAPAYADVVPPPAPEAEAAGPLTAQQILDKMDENLVFESRTTTMKMTVEGKQRTRVFEILSFGRGETDGASEYLSPAREKGTKMLKLGDELWMYMPSIDRVQKISGHMLRKGMMGSDLSYEDMMESERTEDAYKAELLGEEPHDGRPCWKLEMTSHDDSVTYPKRTVWIDKELYIPLKQDMYALSGMLLKTWTMSDIKEYDGGRKYPSKMVIQDMIKADSKTTLEFTEMTFGVELPAEVFSKRWLERK
jgi:outer membrane lipoprotein-sorting protein